MNYWLAPNGRVYAGEKVGCHCELALSIIDNKFSEILDKHGMTPPNFDPIDFLERKGYIRYMDWSDNPHWIIYHQKPTRHQVDKMFALTGFIFDLIT